MKTSMTTTSLSKLLGSAALFLTMAIRSTALAETTECKQGICIHLADTVIGGKAAKVVSFSGLPRVGDYATNFYNVIFPGEEQREFDFSVLNEQFVLSRSGTVSVQACRRLLNYLGKHTKCTGWVRFTVEVSPASAGTAKPVVPVTAPAPVPLAKPPKLPPTQPIPDPSESSQAPPAQEEPTTESPANWDVSGELQLQSAALVVMNLTQSGNQITGTAIALNKQGKVNGSVAGDAFTAKVTWGPSMSGPKVLKYSGKIDEKGMIKGSLISDGANLRSESFASVTAIKRLQSDTDGSPKKHKKKHKHHHHDDEEKSRDEG